MAYLGWQVLPCGRLCTFRSMKYIISPSTELSFQQQQGNFVTSILYCKVDHLEPIIDKLSH